MTGRGEGEGCGVEVADGRGVGEACAAVATCVGSVTGVEGMGVAATCFAEAAHAASARAYNAMRIPGRQAVKRLAGPLLCGRVEWLNRRFAESLARGFADSLSR